MKLLLTSNGLSNQSIGQAFKELIGKDPKDSKVAFIPTAAHDSRFNKDWLIKDLYRILQQGYYVDIVELAAFKKDQLRQVLGPADAIFVGGGNSFYLSYWMQKSGLSQLIPELVKTKVYAGISAGSIITGKSLALASQALENPQAFSDKDYSSFSSSGEASAQALQLVDFVIRPHLNSRYFSSARIDELKDKAKQIDCPVYAIDDNSAIKVVDAKIDIISEGDWQII